MTEKTQTTQMLKTARRSCIQPNFIYLAFSLWCCWLGNRKGIRPVKTWVVGCWHG